jgi:hypothetical protein
VYAVPLRSTHIANATSHTRERYTKSADLTNNAITVKVKSLFNSTKMESPREVPTIDETIEDAKAFFDSQPTIDQVHAFFIERGLELDPEQKRFYHQLLVNHFRIIAAADIA